MRYVLLPAIAFLCFAGSFRGYQPAPSYYATDSAVSTAGDKVAGHIGACLVGLAKKPKICFGLTKEFDTHPQFSFLVLFRTGKKNCEPTGVETQVQSDGVASQAKNVFSLGEFQLPLALETKRDPKTNKVGMSKVVVGDVEVSGKQSGVVVVDLTGEKPVYRLVKVDLPECKIDLADKNHTTWPKGLDDAIAELKKKSKEIAVLAD